MPRAPSANSVHGKGQAARYMRAITQNDYSIKGAAQIWRQEEKSTKKNQKEKKNKVASGSVDWREYRTNRNQKVL